MSALFKLWFLKQRANIRNLFKKPTSAIFTVLMIVIYGSLIIGVLTAPKDPTMQTMSIDMSILLGIGMGAILSLSVLMNKRKALFMEEDSFYLFCGPFSRKQVMRFLMSQTLVQSILFALLCAFIMTCFSVGSGLTFGFVGASIFGFMLMLFFFLVFTDYLYILSITNKKYKKYAYLVTGALIAIVLGIFVLSLAQNNFDFKNGLLDFAQSEVFYFVPIFGWVKLFISSLMVNDIVMALLGIGLLLLANGVLYYFFTSFKGEFYEQAMMDSIEVSAYMKQVKAGKQNAMNLNAKVRDKSIKFRPGAAAIFSKNFLIMMKTGDFIRTQDLLVLVFYFIISLITDMGFGMFCYMMIIYIFQLLQTSDLVQELKNYQIYLIPANPFSKLIYALLPTLLKITLVSGVAVMISGIFYRMGIGEIVNYIVMLLGYAMIFVSGTVLSIRILKSRTNMMTENLLRMFIILICTLPSIILMGIMIFQMGIYDVDTLNMASYVSLILNFVLSFIILYFCKGMMNGREISSD